MPRLLILDEYLRCKSVEPKIILEKDPTHWQLRTLELLGIERDRLIFSGPTLKVKYLYIPSFPRKLVKNHNFSVVSPKSLKKLRRILQHQVICKQQIKSSNRIIISRKYAQGRKVINENELISSLEPYGFKSYILERMTFDEQLSLFSDASIVVGPHGAGLSNILFCKPGTIIVELYSNYYNAVFYTLAQSLNLKYSIFQCDLRKTINPKRGNLIVNTKDLVSFCENLL